MQPDKETQKVQQIKKEQQQVKKQEESKPQTQSEQPALSMKKAQLITEMIKAQKEKDRRKLKYYKQLLKKHNFWDNQPTLRDDKQQIQYGNIEGERKVADVRKQPLEIPDGLIWTQINLNDEKQLDEFYHLLTNHYVEDDDNTFRFDYSREFLKWALSPPGAQPKWIIGIRDPNANNEMIASITGVPVTVLVQQDQIKMSQINFLCVHKKYRSKNLAPKLIAEVTRRVNLKNKWQAIYTSGTVLPTPFTQAVYYHRSLNPKKLIDIGFSGLGKNQTIPMMKKLYNLPEQPTMNLRLMHKKDVPSLTKLINDSMKKYKVKFHYSQQEVRHYFLTRENVVYSYVQQNPDKKHEITDFLSFYMLPSHVMKHPKHNMLYACYSFMNFATTVPLKQLFKNALIMASQQKCDVYNCLNLMDNATIFEDLYFLKGDGHLNYYFFNWIMKCKHITPEELGVVLF